MMPTSGRRLLWPIQTFSLLVSERPELVALHRDRHSVQLTMGAERPSRV